MMELDQLEDAAVLVYAYLSRDGQQFRARVNNLAVKHRNSLKELRDYLLSPEDTPLLNGLVTSAYAKITGDVSPMQHFRYGGLGFTSSEGGRGLEFGNNQLHFAKLSGTALQGATFNGNSGYGSESLEQAGQGSYVSETALRNSRNSDEAFMYITLADKAFADSVNTDKALLHAKYLGTQILQGAVNHSELQKFVDNLPKLEIIGRKEKKRMNRIFLPKRKRPLEGARMLRGLSRFYIPKEEAKIEDLLSESLLINLSE